MLSFSAILAFKCGISSYHFGNMKGAGEFTDVARLNVPTLKVMVGLLAKQRLMPAAPKQYYVDIVRDVLMVGCVPYETLEELYRGVFLLRFP